jgi:NAD(P)-dependent dehydrogenase (short-subunit alcohol dehydrogenase family)
VAVVTGANGGLGYHVAMELARHGAHVVMGCRDMERAQRAQEAMSAERPRGSTELRHLDLADLSSVRNFAAEYAGAHGRCDLLVNNAGLMAVPPRRTVDGFELQFGINHLGHFALTGRMLPLLLNRQHKPTPARVVTVTSTAHRMGRIDFADLNGELRYSKWRAYAQSKLANLLFTFELARRAEAVGAPLVSTAAHPGVAHTDLQRRGPRMAGQPVRERLQSGFAALLGRSAAEGARSLLYAATMPDVSGGECFGPGGRGQLAGPPKRVGVSRAARDPAAAARLWSESERLTGVSYDWSTVPSASRPG